MINNEREVKIKILEALLDGILESVPKQENPPFHAILDIVEYQYWGVDVDYISYLLKKLEEQSYIHNFGELEFDDGPPFSKPISFHAEIWPEGVKQAIAELKELDDSTYPVKLDLNFNNEKSELKINGKKIKITERNQTTVAHYILEQIFKDIKDRPFFSEIAKDKLEEEKDTYNWRKYYYACKRLQEKIRRTAGIDDFLIFSSGKTGSVQINPRYT